MLWCKQRTEILDDPSKKEFIGAMWCSQIDREPGEAGLGRAVTKLQSEEACSMGMIPLDKAKLPPLGHSIFKVLRGSIQLAEALLQGCRWLYYRDEREKNLVPQLLYGK